FFTISGAETVFSTAVFTYSSHNPSVNNIILFYMHINRLSTAIIFFTSKCSYLVDRKVLCDVK
ncbi:MAG TPA: hypothetical protein PLQ68_10280, partial [Clostridia bacterium]|nr:hypothetical protein [Clostridia bacterium]